MNDVGDDVKATKPFFCCFLSKQIFCASSNEFEWWTKEEKTHKKVWGNSLAFSLLLESVFSSKKKIISIPLTAFPFNYSQLRGYWFFYSFLILSLPVHGTYTWVASKTTQPTCFLTIVGLSCVLLTAIAIELNAEQCKSHNKRRRRRTKSNYSINSSSFCGFVKRIWKIAFSFLFRVSL